MKVEGDAQRSEIPDVMVQLSASDTPYVQEVSK